MEILLRQNLQDTGRVAQVRGMFDLPDRNIAERRWTVDLPLTEKPWHIGLIVGASGCGKSTIAGYLWPAEAGRQKSWSWPPLHSIVDAFPDSMSIKEIVSLLSSVGFSSPPSWLLPYQCLSTGEKFRVELARLLAESPELALCDEYSSVVDRTVAQIGSAAVHRTVHARGQKFIAVTCHEDVEEWLQPDWVFRPETNAFTWRSLRQRPLIRLEIFRALAPSWKLFGRHHYLSTDCAQTATCFMATWRNRPVAFSAWLPQVVKKPTMREHRTVTLPDFQGVGIGHALSGHIARMWRGLGYDATSVTTHPAFIAQRNRDPEWEIMRLPSLQAGTYIWKRATTRLTASFRFVGKPMARSLARDLHGGYSEQAA